MIQDQKNGMWKKRKEGTGVLEYTKKEDKNIQLY
jgi:hypothetical protein